MLYTDALVVSGLAGGQTVSLDANNNMDGFIDPSTGQSFVVGVTFGPAPGDGTITIPFQRAEGAVADIIIGGTAFISPEACPDRADCLAAAIPTMGEWGLMILALLLLIVSVVKIKDQALILEPKKVKL